MEIYRERGVKRKAVKILEDKKQGVTSKRPEVFLLDYSGQPYELDIALCFVQRLREVRKFYLISTDLRLIATKPRDVCLSGQLQ
ncbi:MAG TPA: riboflavin kinase [Desulfuromonadaceae bacterium]